MAVVDESGRTYSHPLYDFMLDVPGLSVAVGPVDRLLTWGLKNALWIFPMATSCCGIEFMAAAASRVDMDRMGVIIRGTPRQADVMVVAGTITVKMAPRVKKLWDMMPEPKWCVAMGSCAISGDFYRDLYPSIPGIDTVVPVDVYVPGCPPNPEELMAGMIRLQEKVKLVREGRWPKAEARPELDKMIRPAIRRLSDVDRDPKVSEAQVARSAQLVESAPMVERPTAPREVVADGADSTPAPVADADMNAVLTAFGATEFPKDAPPLIPSDRHRALAEALQQRGHRQLTFVVASHWPEKRDKTGETVTDPEHFELAYGVRSSGRGTSLVQWRVRVNVTDPIDSLWGIYAGADWHEREQYDLFGVNFAGHPDLRRILLPHDYEFFPLRKDRAADAPCFPWR